MMCRTICRLAQQNRTLPFRRCPFAKSRRSPRHLRGAYDLKPTPRDVSRFVRDTFDVPLDLSNVADDTVFNRTQLDLIFEGVAKVLIGRGDVTVEMP
jgi:hypothetical protein